MPATLGGKFRVFVVPTSSHASKTSRRGTALLSHPASCGGGEEERFTTRAPSTTPSACCLSREDDANVTASETQTRVSGAKTYFSRGPTKFRLSDEYSMAPTHKHPAVDPRGTLVDVIFCQDARYSFVSPGPLFFSSNSCTPSQPSAVVCLRREISDCVARLEERRQRPCAGGRHCGPLLSNSPPPTSL